MSRTRCLTLTFGDGGLSPIFSSRLEYLVHLPYDIVRCIASSLTLYWTKNQLPSFVSMAYLSFLFGKPFPRNRPNKIYNEASLHVHPGRLTWNLQITHLERKVIFQTSMIVVHVNLPGCIATRFPGPISWPACPSRDARHWNDWGIPEGRGCGKRPFSKEIRHSEYLKKGYWMVEAL